jgi:hypothetical protein
MEKLEGKEFGWIEGGKGLGINHPGSGNNQQ